MYSDACRTNAAEFGSPYIYINKVIITSRSCIVIIETGA